MTKRLIALLLSTLLVFALAGCSKNEAAAKTNYEGTLEDLMTSVYDKKPVELKLGPTTAVDLTNSDNVTYFLGLSDAESIKEAVYSEAMMTSQAYSVCLVRAKEGTDIEKLKQNILDGINPRKWICVGADKVVVSNYGDVIALIMTDSGLSENLTEDLYTAFTQVVGGELGKKLERTDG